MNKVVRVVACGAMVLVTAVLAVLLSPHMVSHYELPSGPGDTVVPRTDVHTPVVAAVVVCGVACLLLAGWTVLNLLTRVRSVFWVAPAVALASAVIAFAVAMPRHAIVY